MDDDDDTWGAYDQSDQDPVYFDHHEPVLAREESCRVMDMTEVRKRQAELVAEVAEVFEVSADQSFALLVASKWEVERLEEAWWSEEGQASLRAKSGIGSGSLKFSQQKRALSPPENLCLVCYQEVAEVYGIERCQHFFCHDCWSFHVRTQLDEGPQVAAQMKCPEVSCKLSVPVGLAREIFKNISDAALGPEESREAVIHKFEKFLAMSFTEANRFVRWCPEAGCPFALEAQSGHLLRRAACKCGAQVCLRCGGECHLPASCELRAAWQLKNQSEEENASWVLANTKQCPSCAKPIEKNQGCNRMQCRCGYQFCWLCMVEWEAHGGYSGTCNQFKAQEEQKRVDQQAAVREGLARYLFFFERFKNHERSATHVTRLKPLLQKNSQLLYELRSLPFTETEVLLKAAKTVSQARQVLKWTYVHAYYLGQARKDIELLQYQQQKLDANCDQLHGLLEKPFEPFFRESDSKLTAFFQFKGEVASLAAATQTFYKHLVEAFQDDE